MRNFMLSFVAVAIVLGGIWVVATKPRAGEQLRAEAQVVTMDVHAMMRKAGRLPETYIGSLY